MRARRRLRPGTEGVPPEAGTGAEAGAADDAAEDEDDEDPALCGRAPRVLGALRTAAQAAMAYTVSVGKERMPPPPLPPPSRGWRAPRSIPDASRTPPTVGGTRR